MNVFTQTGSLQTHLDQLKSQKKSIGFVPTMGALHEGHSALIERAMKENEEVVCSIFVNPTQFNEKEDLKSYPVETQKDLKRLEKQSCQTVFLPDAEEIYPRGTNNSDLDYGSLSQSLEGSFRPGHFDGMMQVVSRFFDIVKPDKAYFGEKDFQQLAIIREWVKRNDFPVEIVGCEIVREKSGLALSSRNARLSPEDHEKACRLNQILKKAINRKQDSDPNEIEEWGMEKLRAIPGCEPEYLAIVNGRTLEKASTWQKDEDHRILLAAWIGGVRLIDNMAI